MFETRKRLEPFHRFRSNENLIGTSVSTETSQQVCFIINLIHILKRRVALNYFKVIESGETMMSD